ncbi:hypothetical protein BpHYR1_043707 [Brachionus plicatilis]|uniref:Uncharacterized protein n=1 Tax=Brachionus plicatilis TaxID=10195 RepID=A0A3M7T4J9_BRAPC|nr:hypothetical protein BpHYR1_043707 [Brachionus plicatilis]
MAKIHNPVLKICVFIKKNYKLMIEKKVIYILFDNHTFGLSHWHIFCSIKMLLQAVLHYELNKPDC